MPETITQTQQRGLVIMSALLNFVDWLDGQSGFQATEKERGALVLAFLDSHSPGENYSLQVEDIAQRLGEPFEEE